MRPVRVVLLAALVAAFFVPGVVSEEAGSCTSQAGVCWEVPGIFGTTCPAPSTFSPSPCPPPPTPTPELRQGEILWRPAEANYVEGPGAVRDSGHVYVYGHTGKCCYAPIPYGPGFEAPFLIDYGPDAVETVFPLLPYWTHDTHELAYGTMVAGGDGWLWIMTRTTWSSWLAQTDPPRGRARGVVATTDNPMRSPWPVVWWDSLVPWDWTCLERLTCPGLGPIMFSAVWLDGELLIFVGDSEGFLQDPGHTGMVVWSGVVEPAERRVGFTRKWETTWPAGQGAAFSDVAVDSDGVLHALVSASGNGPPSCWWFSCGVVDEFLSRDGGRSWERGTRTWSVGGGLYTWDAGYLRDKWGHVDADALVVLALVSESMDPRSGSWKIRWWADEGAEVPAGWLPPVPEPRVPVRPPRKHLTRAGR